MWSTVTTLVAGVHAKEGGEEVVGGRGQGGIRKKRFRSKLEKIYSSDENSLLWD